MVISLEYTRDELLARTCMLIGEEGLDLLWKKSIAVFGAGGVGGHCIEALARCGIGHIHIVDADRVAESNLNRQIFAARSTIGMLKVDAARRRIEDISCCKVTTGDLFVLPDNVSSAIPEGVDYVIDAIDTVAAKVALACEAKRRGIPIISSMGMGNRLVPGNLRVTDIYDTKGCPLARAMRHQLRKMGVDKLKVLVSDSPVIKPKQGAEGRQPPGSISYVPAMAGLMLCGTVVSELLLCAIKRD